MDKIKNRENSGVSVHVHGNRVNKLRFADVSTFILLNRAMRKLENCRIQSTNCIQKVHDMECI